MGLLWRLTSLVLGIVGRVKGGERKDERVLGAIAVNGFREE